MLHQSPSLANRLGDYEGGYLGAGAPIANAAAVRLDIVQLLLSYGATPTHEDADEAWPAAAHNWLRITPLHEAARTGDLEKATALLDAGADLTARDEHLRSTPLAWAAKFGQRGRRR